MLSHRFTHCCCYYSTVYQAIQLTLALLQRRLLFLGAVQEHCVSHSNSEYAAASTLLTVLLISLSLALWFDSFIQTWRIKWKTQWNIGSFGIRPYTAGFLTLNPHNETLYCWFPCQVLLAVQLQRLQCPWGGFVPQIMVSVNPLPLISNPHTSAILNAPIRWYVTLFWLYLISERRDYL